MYVHSPQLSLSLRCFAMMLSLNPLCLSGYQRPYSAVMSVGRLGGCSAKTMLASQEDDNGVFSFFIPSFMHCANSQLGGAVVCFPIPLCLKEADKRINAVYGVLCYTLTTTKHHKRVFQGKSSAVHSALVKEVISRILPAGGAEYKEIGACAAFVCRRKYLGFFKPVTTNRQTILFLWKIP